MIMSSISRPEHLDIFEKGIAEKIDFSYAGAQSLRVSQMIEDENVENGRNSYISRALRTPFH